MLSSRRRPAAPAVLLALGLTLTLATGCSSDEPGAAALPGPDAATAGLPSEPPTATAPVAAPTGAPPPPSPRFGRTFRYAGGLAVTVAAPERFRPSGWVQREPGIPMRFEVTVRNRTGDTWNPSRLHARLLSGFAPAVPIFDHDQQVVARPEERLPDGATTTFAVGFWVPDAEQLALELVAGFGYQPVTITGG